MIVVGLAGRIGAGKSAIAERLRDAWGFTVVSFADGLREELLERMPLTLRAIHDMTDGCTCYRGDQPYPDPGLYPECLRRMLYEVKPLGFRELLQEYGSQVRRADDPDYWAKRWYERFMKTLGPVVVPDVRFPNEARAIRNMGGLLWHVDRPGYDSGSQHASETALAHWMDWDAEIRNEGTLAELHAKVDAQAQRWVHMLT